MLLVLGVPAAAKEPVSKPAIQGLQVTSVADGYLVSYRLDNALSEEELTRVHDGVPLTFRHKIELLGGRLGPLLPRKTLGRTLVDTTVRYDTLTRRYEVQRELRGKVWPRTSTKPELSERRLVTTMAEVERWMTELIDVPLPPTEARPAAGLRVRVKSELGHRFVLLVFPSKTTVADELIVEP